MVNPTPAQPVSEERPILFSAPMVRALLDGRKTQTRRVVKWKPRGDNFNQKFSGIEAGFYSSDASSGWVLRSREGIGGCWNDRTWPIHCPYGSPGDRLWVRETWAIGAAKGDGAVYRADLTDDDIAEEREVRRLAPKLAKEYRESRWRPSIHMPRFASRITLEVTGVRVERLQEISQADCVAEGMSESTNGFVHHVVADYRKLWSEINGADSWAANPWVWVIEFKRVSQ